MNCRVIVEPTKIGQRGQHYRVTLEDGSELIPDTRNPELDACRALLARGISGTLETYRPGNPHACMVLDIPKAAKLTVREDDRHSPQLVRYRAPSWDAVSYDAGAGKFRQSEEPWGDTTSNA